MLSFGASIVDQLVNDATSPSLPWENGFSSAWPKLQDLQQALLAHPNGSYVDKWLLQLAANILVSMLQDANSAVPFRVAGCQILDIIGRRWPAAKTWWASALGLAQYNTSNDDGVWARLVGKLCFNVDCPGAMPKHLVIDLTCNPCQFMVMAPGLHSPGLMYANVNDRSLRWIDMHQVALHPNVIKLLNPWSALGGESGDTTLPVSSSLSTWVSLHHLPKF